ncbi:MAG: hypothetical protein K9M57_00450 [Phycisphaerae bacterium]|nr:hypothetical protein [Phycisphaerae bacterium]
MKVKMDFSGMVSVTPWAQRCYSIMQSSAMTLFNFGVIGYILHIFYTLGYASKMNPTDIHWRTFILTMFILTGGLAYYLSYYIRKKYFLPGDWDDYMVSYLKISKKELSGYEWLSAGSPTNNSD